MSQVVLDSSALIALLKAEPGGDKIAGVIGDSVMTAVNYAEVVSHFVYNGMPPAMVDAMLGPLPVVIVAADTGLASTAGHLRAMTAAAGLSLGDRFCLALAKREKRPAWTADRQWLSVAEQVGVDIVIIR
jgi:ribonuclease VapC